MVDWNAAQVGIKRRYNNVLVDSDKQQQIEMFLGMKQPAYFPSIKLLYQVRPAWPCWVLCCSLL